MTKCPAGPWREHCAALPLKESVCLASPADFRHDLDFRLSRENAAMPFWLA